MQPASNSLLAKLLATENITVQHQPGVKTAMFDLKNRVLILPIWENVSQDLEHLLIGHETGHALDTPTAEEYQKAYMGIAERVFGPKPGDRLIGTVSGFLNVVEDARIDKRQKRRYPGLRKNYLLGYKELYDRGFFGTTGRDINSMNFIDRANLYFKGGNVGLNIDFSPEERVFLKRIEALETFEDTVTLTEEIYLYCKGKIEGDSNDLSFGSAEEGDEDDSDFNFDFPGSSDEDGDDGEDADSEDGEGKSGDDEDSDQELSSQANVGAGSDGQDITHHAPESVTDRAWQDASQKLVKDENAEYIYLDMPDVNWTKAVHGYKRVLEDWRKDRGRWGYSQEQHDLAVRHFTAWRQKEKDTISFLVKEFEQRKAAEMYSRIQIAKTGVIDTNKLHSYKYNDDIFRRLSILPAGKNHGFVMFLDWSGSMDYNLKYTMRQLFTLVLFCKQIQVPFEVYAFKDAHAENPFSYMKKTNCLGFGNVVLRQFLSSKMTLVELNEAMAVLWHISHGGSMSVETMSGTPLNQAIFLAPKIVNDFRAKHKLEVVNTIFLTDGESNGLEGVKNPTFQGHSWGMKTGNRRQFFYSDKETGKTYEMAPYGWGGAGTNNTVNLLKLLKEKTGCNLIGFFLYGESWNHFMRRFNLENGSYQFRQKITKQWKENKFYGVKSEGYDDYYVIDSRALRNVSNVLEIDNTKTNKAMAKQFAKFASKKTVNRVLLRNFIDHVVDKPRKIA